MEYPARRSLGEGGSRDEYQKALKGKRHWKDEL
jgi:hypothetical protein